MPRSLSQLGLADAGGAFDEDGFFDLLGEIDAVAICRLAI